MIKPFSPTEVEASIKSTKPDEVIAAFNELLAENFGSYGNYITLSKDDIITRIRSKIPNVSRNQILEGHWLDIEPLYRAEGWNVAYESPDYGDSHSGYFTFRRYRSEPD